ncbi:MAG: TonB-dependent receptor [Acidobacteriota bacterium]|nr:TonB-dependent receptor [Acidobacteriota bacterium]
MKTPVWIIICLFAGHQGLSYQEEGAPVRESMTVVYTPEDFAGRDGSAPKLVYDQRFFERFQPQSVGDILKRIPGISGSADAGEFDRPQMRGIGPQYTRILIDGLRVPGAGNDRTLVIDRIPAHLVKRIEVIRAPEAGGDAQGIAGTINIVLKDSAGESGFDLLLGHAYSDQDQKHRGRTGMNWRDRRGNVSYSITGSAQQRHNPKSQLTDIVDGEGTEIFKDETNILDGRDTALNTDLNIDSGNGAAFSGALSYLADERKEDETAIFSEAGEVQEEIFDFGDTSRENWGARLAYRRPVSDFGELRLSAGHNAFSIDSRLDIGVFEDGEAVQEELETDRTEDRETGLKAAFAFVRGNHRIETGIDLAQRKRDADFRLFEFEDGEMEEVELGGVFRIEERRRDAYLKDTWQIDDRHHLQLGLRYEFTETDMPDANLRRDGGEFYPSLHYGFMQSENNRFRLSITRTTKRPDFMDLQPFQQRDTPFDDQVTLGNPDLKAEMAWGIDLGYERSFSGQEGTFGLNFFERHISDRVETVGIGEDIFQIRNAGDGKVYGLEFDFGMPLTGIGLPNLSLFANLTLQDSELTDALTGERRPFNLQPETVVNLSLLHSFPGSGFSYGVNWLEQSDFIEDLTTEKGVIDYGPHLELVLEKRWGNGWVLSFLARNLLDSAKRVYLEEYEGRWTEEDPAQILDEREYSGRSFLLTLKAVLGRHQ